MSGKKAKLIDTCLNAAQTLVEDTIKLTLELTAIPAPTFSEQARAEFYARELRARGIADVVVDDISNVVDAGGSHRYRVPDRDADPRRAKR